MAVTSQVSSAQPVVAGELMMLLGIRLMEKGRGARELVAGECQQGRGLAVVTGGLVPRLLEGGREPRREAGCLLEWELVAAALAREVEVANLRVMAKVTPKAAILEVADLRVMAKVTPKAAILLYLHSLQWTRLMKMIDHLLRNQLQIKSVKRLTSQV